MPAARASGSARLDAQVVASHGQRFGVETQEAGQLSCLARPRLGTIVCGDRVQVVLTGPGEGVIEARLPRTSLIYRSDHRREKPIAANVTRVIVVVACVPRPNVEFVDRCLAAAEHAGVKTLLVQNKIDLDPERALHASLLARYDMLGYPTCRLSAHASIEPLRPALQGEASVLIGQSGVGKSTLVNALLPAAAARTGEISRSQGGRHTTTHARLYRLVDGSMLIDSPGMHQFGVQHIAPEELAACFVEFRPFLGQCRFANCRHVDEPGCALKQAVNERAIAPERLRSYTRILHSLVEFPSAGGRSEPARHRDERNDEQP